MNLTNKIVILAVLTLVSAGFIARKSQDVGTLPEPTVPQFTVLIKPAQEHVEALLAADEKLVWDDFARFGITQELLEQYKQNNLVDDKECIEAFGDKRPLSESIVSLVKNTAQDFELNADLMTICAYKNEAPAAATDTAMMINENALGLYKKDVQTFIIAHELQHMIHQDYYVKCLIKNIIKDKKIDWQQIEPFYNNYVRFTELRADLKAAIKNFDYAIAYVAASQQLIREQGNHGDPMHPYPIERLQFATNIIEQMTQKHTQKTV